MGIGIACVHLVGIADATGEKTRFQAKNRFFHSGVSFFSLGKSAVFPLGTRGRRTKLCSGGAASHDVRALASALEGALANAGKQAVRSSPAVRPLQEKTSSTSRQRWRFRARRNARTRPREAVRQSFVCLIATRHGTKNAMTSFATCDLCDAHEEDASGAFRVLPPVFRDFGATMPFCGKVATLRCIEDNSRVREAVNSPGEGRVLVIDGGASTRRALVGGNLAAAAAKNGWAGIVVDGAVRDAAELVAAGIGIKALALMPLRSVKRGEGQRDLAVEIQGVPVRPGDWLYADADGIVVSATPLT
jgi:regulator of ribonuclease activity A